MLSLIYSFRDRNIKRVKNSLDSLKNQTSQSFNVYFVDYGSEKKCSDEIEDLCSSYSFVEFFKLSTQFQPWNKSKALNSVIRQLKKGYCFVADVDMIFHPEFVTTAIALQKGQNSVYFKVGFTEPQDIIEDIKPEEFGKFRQSNREATGMTMFPVKVIQELRGFDEFYHFWGAEDTDAHVRLKNAGHKLEYYKDETLLLHQWHPSYRSMESKTLTSDFQISGIVQLNHQHLLFAIHNSTTIVNHDSWGKGITEHELKELEQAPVNHFIDNEKTKINDLLYGQLPAIKNAVFKIVVKEKNQNKTIKHVIKRIVGRKVPQYYSLKEVNDRILIHIISFYRNLPYSYKIDKDNGQIEVAIIFGAPNKKI